MMEAFEYFEKKNRGNESTNFVLTRGAGKLLRWCLYE